MSRVDITKYGTLACSDTGAPPGSSNYTTIVMLHGFTWHGNVFKNLAPYASKYNLRFIFVNRRDYPGSDQYEQDERDLISPSRGTTAASVRAFLDHRAVELTESLKLMIAEKQLPRAHGTQGGVILVGWSFSGAWILSFLARMSAAPHEFDDLRPYLRRVVLYDIPYHVFGYPPPYEQYHPMHDATLDPLERPKAFAAWVSGYFLHGDSANELELKRPLEDPLSTILTISNADRDECLFFGPGDPGGSDVTLVDEGTRHGVYARLKDDALFLRGGERGAWDDVEVVYLWCDRSVWEMPWGTWALQAELEEAKNAGRRMRNIKMRRMRGANHFAHWDQPERVVRAVLVGSDVPQLSTL